MNTLLTIEALREMGLPMRVESSNNTIPSDYIKINITAMNEQHILFKDANGVSRSGLIEMILEYQLAPKIKDEIIECLVDRLYLLARDWGIDDGSNVEEEYKKELRKIISREVSAE